MILSIIIPVYHVERTLDRCVEGVLRQDLDDFEVILVDDGGDDNCPRMWDEWARRRRDTHVRVVHQSNAGLSAARNAGIELAQGDYLTFVDSDDYLDDGLYARLLPILQTQPDIDLLEYSVIVREGGSEQRNRPKSSPPPQRDSTTIRTTPMESPERPRDANCRTCSTRTSPTSEKATRSMRPIMRTCSTFNCRSMT